MTRAIAILLGAWLGACATSPLRAQDAPAPAPHDVPRVWDVAELAAGATPLAGLDAPPTFLSEEAWYALPVDDLATDPVYHPDFEPPGYREALRRRGPRPLIEPETLRDDADWVEAGRRVFEQLDTPATRTSDPEVVAHFTDAAAIDRWRDATHDVLGPDGTLLDYRWVVARDGTLQVSLASCSGCHTRLMPDGSLLLGAPSNFDLSESPAADRLLSGLDQGGLSRGESFLAQYGVPWRDDDPHAAIVAGGDAALDALFEADTGAPPGTTFARFGGSPLFVTRMADLRGLRDRRWLDATATHAHRGPGDLARYAALVEYAPETVFGAHAVLPDRLATARVRPSDAALWALALFLESLEPAPSPHPRDERARRGELVFGVEGCTECHAPPTYTNDALVPVPGFVPSDEARARLPVSKRRVGTDPGLALRTRRGTGYYRVPSLRGLWYRGLFGHSGQAASLEEWFDPARLRDDHVPGGWRAPGVATQAIVGHEFGLDLGPDEKADLIAFLLTL